MCIAGQGKNGGVREEDLLCRPSAATTYEYGHAISSPKTLLTLLGEGGRKLGQLRENAGGYTVEEGLDD